MTKNELWKGVVIRGIAAVAFLVIGYVAVRCALQMVSIFGEGLGTDARSKDIYGRSHIVIHLFAAACSLTIGIFLLDKFKGLATLAIFAMLACGSYGITNMAGFASTNRVSVAAAKDAANNASEREYKAARADLEGQIKWLEGQTATAETPREKRRMEKEVDAKRKELSAVKAPRPTAETVLSDSQASVFSRLTSLDEITWQGLLSVFPAILLFIAESFSFLFAGHLIASIIGLFAAFALAQAASASEPGEPEKTQGGSGGSSGSGGGEPRKKPDLKPVPKAEPAPLRAEPTKQRSAFYVPATGAPERLSAFDIAYELAQQNPHLSTRALVKQAEQAGRQFSQSTAMRVKKRLSGKVHQTVRKYGNGRGYQTPAYN